MKIVMHLGPITKKLSGFIFLAYCPAEGEVETRNYRTEAIAERERSAIATGINLSGGSVVFHQTADSFDEATKESAS